MVSGGTDIETDVSGVIVPILDFIEKETTLIVSTTTNDIIGYVMPIFSLALTIAVITRASISVLHPEEPFPVAFWLKKWFYWQLIIAVCGAGGYYTEYFVKDIINIPDHIANLVANSINHNNTQQGMSGFMSVGKDIDSLLIQGMQIGRKAWNNGNVSSSGGLASLLSSLGIFSTVWSFSTTAGLIVLCQKVLITITMVLGPLAILCLLFNSTKGFFDRWVNTIVTLSLVIVIEGIVFAIFQIFLTKLFTSTAGALTGTDINATNKVTEFTAATEIFIVGLIGTKCLLLSTQLAQSLGGGLSVSLNGVAGNAFNSMISRSPIKSGGLLNGSSAISKSSGNMLAEAQKPKGLGYGSRGNNNRIV